ncbi:hypothetical protein RCA_02745 [Rickettsia canadensis str. CA410]|uniref:Uncharacterized protein n=1 Tax=Rickettsia canadensis str. CA410 TaxID=1105107 RepID=A0ABM5MRP0_RICCA|nr:hypothetical protein RCA_02745 [Rickettsia canadensis str. CA410]
MDYFSDLFGGSGGCWEVSQEQAAFYQGLVLHLVDSLQKAVRLNKAHIVGD